MSHDANFKCPFFDSWKFNGLDMDHSECKVMLLLYPCWRHRAPETNTDNIWQHYPTEGFRGLRAWKPTFRYIQFNLKWFQFTTEDKASGSWRHWLSTAFRRHCESALFLPHVTSHLRWCKVKIEDALRMCIECIGCLTASALCTACGCHMLPYPWSISADRSRSELSGSEMKQMK